MALVQIRVRCEERFRECPRKCWGCVKAVVVEVKNLSGKPPESGFRKDPRANEYRRSGVRGNVRGSGRAEACVTACIFNPYVCCKTRG